MKKILLLSASAGGGHNSAAKAIKNALDKLGCEVLIVDALKFVSPILDKIIAGGYEKSAKYIPKTYGSIYNMSGGGKSRKKNLDNIIRQVMGKKILELVKDNKPDAIVCTHPFAMMAIIRNKEKGIINVPVVSILTDYTAHSSYIQNSVDAFIVGDEDVSYILKKEGISEDKIFPFGIPVSEEFLNTDRVDEVKSELQLEDKFTVLLMGGSFGAGNIKDSLLELINIKHDLQIIVVAGRDHVLKAKLEKLLLKITTNKTVRILGFTKDMRELLTIGDVLVSKPGGLTTTEAILKGIPMIIPCYIPGQEAENVDFLLNSGLALKTTKNYTLPALVEMLLDNPDRRQDIVDRMLKRRKLGSANQTANLVVKLITENEKH